MPYYKRLKDESAATRKRTVKGLQALRSQYQDVRFPTKKITQSLVLGTWNIRNFDDDRFDYGPREEESFYYLAEIISWFDIIAVQEINADLYPMNKLMSVLGGSYKYILTDITHSGLGGNKERLGFIYDTNKVKFKGVSGEIVLPKKMLIGEDGTLQRQFSRTPFGAEFQSGWFKFNFSTVHIYYGSNSKGDAKYRRRVGEIEAVARYIAKEAKSNPSNQILVGDFNIIKPGSDGDNALRKCGFTSVRNRQGSNKDQTKFYDQISFLSRKNQLNLVDQAAPENAVPGLPDRVLQFFDSVYTEDQFDLYRPIMEKRLNEKIKAAEKDLKQATSKTAKKKATKRIESKKKALSTTASMKKYYNEWRTFQMSDHLPLWVEIEIDFTDGYLNYLHEYKKGLSSRDTG